MLYAPLDKILEQFYDTENQSHAIRPTRCKREGCPEEEHFHRHDSYPRKSVYRSGVGWINGVRVQRYRCARCGKVFALIQPSHYKWQRADHITQQAVAFGQYDPTILLEHFSERTLQRWRQKWNVWAQQNWQVILQWLLRTNPELTVNAGAPEVATPLLYLGFLLSQFSENRHSPVTVTAVSRFGGWSKQATPQCLSLSLPLNSLISCQTWARAPNSMN